MPDISLRFQFLQLIFLVTCHVGRFDGILWAWCDVNRQKLAVLSRLNSFSSKNLEMSFGHFRSCHDGRFDGIIGGVLI